MNIASRTRYHNPLLRKKTQTAKCGLRLYSAAARGRREASMHENASRYSRPYSLKVLPIGSLTDA